MDSVNRPAAVTELVFCCGGAFALTRYGVDDVEMRQLKLPFRDELPPGHTATVLPLGPADAAQE